MPAATRGWWRPSAFALLIDVTFEANRIKHALDSEEAESRIRVLREENELLMEQQQKNGAELERLRNELAIKMNQSTRIISICSSYPS